MKEATSKPCEGWAPAILANHTSLHKDSSQGVDTSLVSHGLSATWKNSFTSLLNHKVPVSISCFNLFLTFKWRPSRWAHIVFRMEEQ
jgi:hypothetical protein